MAEATDDRLRLLVERILRLREEKRGIEQDIKDVFAEAKAVGYDTKVMRRLIARLGMKPDEREEADQVLATYEAAFGLDGPDPAVDPDEAVSSSEAVDQRTRELAIAILAEQVEGIQDAGQAERLAEHVTVLLDIRAEIAGLRADEGHRKKLAEGEGFQKGPLTQLVRWIEKCAKHGSEKMRAGEAVFQLYRGTIEARGVSQAAVSDDPKLQALAAPKTNSKLARTMAWLSTGMGD